MKSIPKRKIVEWVLESWGALSKEMVRESFKICGLNLSVDGSEGHLIHCIKEESAYAQMKTTLTQIYSTIKHQL